MQTEALFDVSWEKKAHPTESWRQRKSTFIHHIFLCLLSRQAQVTHEEQWNQPKVGFIVLQCGRDPFSLLLFLDFSSLISPLLFSLICKKAKLSLQWQIFRSKMPKNQIFFFPENKSLSDTDCLYMFHYNGELVLIIYVDIIYWLGPIRISFSL